jgi:CspA family cold shock protein
MRGIVKFFNASKGWGFITPEDRNGPDVFVHYSALATDGYKTVDEGDVVSYETVKDSEGRISASKVVVVEPKNESKPKRICQRCGSDASSSRSLKWYSNGDAPVSDLLSDRATMLCVKCKVSLLDALVAHSSAEVRDIVVDWVAEK